MPKSLKRLFFIFAGLAGLLVIIALVLPFVIPKKRILTWIETQASQALKTKVTIADFNLGFLPPALELEQLQIGSGPAEESLYVRLDRAEVELHWSSILQRKAKVSAVTLDKPEIVLVSSESETKEPQKSETEEGKSEIDVALDSLTINDGDIKILTAKKKPFVHLGKIREKLSASLDKAGRVALKGKLDIGLIDIKVPAGRFGQGLALSLDKELTYELSSGSLNVVRGNISLGDLPLNLTGHVKGLTGGEPIADLKVEGGPAEVKSILGYLPASMFPAIAGVESSGTLAIKGAVQGPLASADTAGKKATAPLKYVFNITLEDGTLKYPKLPVPVKGIRIALNLDETNLIIDRFTAATENSNVAVAGSIKGYALKQKDLNLRVVADIDLEEASAMQPDELEANLAGKAKIDVQLTTPTKKIEAIAYQGKAELSDVNVQGKMLPVPVSQLNGKLSFTTDKLNIEKLTGRLGKSSFATAGTVTSYMENPTGNLTLNANLLMSEVAKVAGLDKSADIGGTLEAKVKASGLLKDMNRLDLSGQLNLDNIAYLAKNSDIPKVQKLSGAVALNKQQIQFTKLSGDIGSSDFNLNGTVDNIHSFYSKKHKKLPLKFNLVLNSMMLNLDELRPKEEPPTDEESDSVTLAAMLKKLEGVVKVAAKKVLFNEIDARQVQGIAKLKAGLFDLSQFSFLAFGGKVNMAGTANFKKATKPTFDLKLDLEKIQVSSLLSYSKQLNRYGYLADHLAGELTTNVSFAGALNREMTLDLSSLDSKGTLKIAKASLTNHPVQNQLAGFLDAPQLKKVSLKKWQQPFKIEQGKLKVNDMKLAAAGFSMNLDGWQAVDGSMGVAMDLDLPQKLSGNIKSYIPAPARSIIFDGSDSNLLVPLKLSGQVTSPKVGVDEKKLSANVEKRLQAKLAAEKDKIKQQATNKAKKAIQKSLNDKKGNNKAKKAVDDLIKGIVP